MAKLNQIIALESSAKARTNDAVSKLHHISVKPDLYAGFDRTYQPGDDEGERMPSESKKVQLFAGDVLGMLTEGLSGLFNLAATKEYANTAAKADVKVDGSVILADCPVTYLLFLEKQLNDIHTFVKKMPTLDPSVNWNPDPSTGGWRGPEVKSNRTKKTAVNHVKAAATDKHPAQVELLWEDVPVGVWSKVEFSGALDAHRHQELVRRVERLQDAVKAAREESNSATATEKKVASPIFDYLFAP